MSDEPQGAAARAGRADPYDRAGDEITEALQEAELALYRHGQQRAREGAESPQRGAAPAIEGDA